MGKLLSYPSLLLGMRAVLRAKRTASGSQKQPREVVNAIGHQPRHTRIIKDGEGYPPTATGLVADSGQRGDAGAVEEDEDQEGQG